MTPRSARAGPPGAPHLLDTIELLAEGNPFFVEELLTSLMATGGNLYSIAPRRGGSADQIGAACAPQSAGRRPATHPAAPAPPPSSRSALAAVVGRRFDFALLHALTQYDEATFLAPIKSLWPRELLPKFRPLVCVWPCPTRQTIYAGLLTRERQILHRRIAEMIERTYADLLDWHVAHLAYHFYEAGLWAKALVYGRRAAERARR